MRISNASSPFSHLSQRLSYANHNGIDAINLVENVPTWPKTPSAEPVSVFEMLNYAPAEGAAALLAAIVTRENKQTFDDSFGPKTIPSERYCQSNILVTNGATQAISLIVQNLPNRKRTILCQSPVFIGIVRLIEAHGFSVAYFQIDHSSAEAAASLMSSDVAAIYLNSPNNPTGNIIQAIEMLEFLNLARDWDAHLIIDAVYEDFCFDGASVPLPRQPSNDLVYLVNSVSKNYGAPGLRVGWIASSAANIILLGGALERECVAVAGQSQMFAAALMSNSNEALVDHVDRARPIIYNALDGIQGLEYAPASSGTQILAHLDVLDIEEFADFALLKYGLILATTSNYGGLASQSIRIPLGLTKKHILSGLTLLERCVAKYKCTENSIPAAL